MSLNCNTLRTFKAQVADKAAVSCLFCVLVTAAQAPSTLTQFLCPGPAVCVGDNNGDCNGVMMTSAIQQSTVV